MAKIDLGIKRKCVEMAESGVSFPKIYNTYFKAAHPEMGYETFRHKLRNWRKQTWADLDTMAAGTYPGFVAHDATVQVGRDGSITQAWIKQKAEDHGIEELIRAIRENTKPEIVVFDKREAASGMLEIPLFDMHFPLCDHLESLDRLLEVIGSRTWEEINIVLGQDLFHNDDFRGRTSSGREIQRVDMVKAWEMAKTFWYTAISEALRHSDRVNIIYSKGNHDESMGWAFVQMLREMFPQAVVDDSLAQRKVIAWKGCFIGLTHGHYKQSAKNDLRGQFTIQFPMEFARATVREIHAGHLHREEEKDIYGVMIRRLCRDGFTDEWSDDEGFIGANRRFMVFHWQPGRLAGIDYI